MTDRIEEAAGILARAHGGGEKPEELPGSCAPRTVSEAHAVQARLAGLLGQGIAGWKIGKPADDTVMRGALLRSRVLQSPAELPAGEVPLLGVEPEIAFRLDRDLDRREGYSEAEVRDAVTAFAAIEVVDSRFRSYHAAPFMHRLADFMSNGALVCGDDGPADWRSRDFTQIEVTVMAGGAVLSRNTGGHASGDPLLPAVALINDMVRTGPLEAGIILTTGTFAGLQFAAPGDTVEVEFAGFGAARVSFPA